ncbi:MAG: fibrillarin-like rRNA/tRNA 2'-O-methyltransferase [Candidatus Korarchaeum sp.]
MRVKEDQNFRNVYWILDGKKQLATRNLTPGVRAYDETLKEIQGVEYRIWNPKRSKLAAAIHNGLRNFPFKRGSKVLYLGIASGTTASHISDVIGESGIIFGVEVAHWVIRDLLKLAEFRKNIIPILESARRPQNYSWLVTEVDIVYEDVAQPDQVDILIRNSDLFLRSGGVAMIAVKASSIDVTLPPKRIYRRVEEEVLGTGRYELLETLDLSPYDPKHAMIVFKRR